MIKLVLLTGFLGAGKTTLMKSILSEFIDARAGVIVNEFGEVNIDARLIEKDGIQMAELSNGSIFCACIKDKFVDSLIEMSYKDLDYIFIEASGLADPANMEQILDGIKNNVLNQYDYSGSICVVDGESFMDLYELLPAITSQIEFSGAVIINKGDLIDEETLKDVSETIGKMNPEAELFVTSYCRVDVRTLVEGLSRSSAEARESCNTVSSRPLTFIVRGEQQIQIQQLELFIKEIAGDTYRIKGFADTDKGCIEVSTVGENIHLEPWTGLPEKTEIVVISSVGFRMMSILAKAIDKYLKGIVRL